MDTVRGFNRYYTRRIGALRGGFLGTPHSLAEARVIFELSRGECEVSELRRELDMDAGHLSRLLARLERSDLVVRRPSAEDGRRQLARLTPAGRHAYSRLDERSTAEVTELLARLSPADRRRLTLSMETIQAILDPRSRGQAPRIRAPRAGDYGWIVEAHGRIYHEQYRWDDGFEALVAEIVAAFTAAHDPTREAAFIADLGGRRAGCVLCVKADESTARLRLLLVEPWARGHGLGGRLVDRCLRFARSAGYERMTLWTNDPLKEARRIYDARGFELVSEEAHRSFGHDLVGQTLERNL